MTGPGTDWTGSWQWSGREIDGQKSSQENGNKPQLIANAAGLIRLDGLFDSFFDSYWTRFTALETVSFQCRAYGQITVTLLRRNATDGTETCLATQYVGADLKERDEGLDIEITVPLANPEAPESRLIVEFAAQAAGARIVAPCWTTRQKPVASPHLGVVITTFNREPFLENNLRQLSGRLDNAQLIVVNHGTPGLENRLAGAMRASDGVRFIDQENSGGAGGFTRGMEEHFAAGNVSHILLMDDDIDLPCDLIQRIGAILSYADTPLCLGGAMFDFHERSQLFSAGDILLPNSFGIAHVAPKEGCDIREAAGVDFLARVHRVDFNGWWCFAFPVKGMMTVGLPMPCFIRGDDVEYGYRLKRAGWPTLGWPGLAVWHMPFDAKAAAWQSFYDRRNALFANALHRRVSRSAAFRKLIGGFLLHLLRYDYARVKAMTHGIAAFNQGAETMERWTHHDHAALVASITPTPLSAAMQKRVALGDETNLISPSPLGKKMHAMTMAARFAMDLLWPWRRTQPVLLAPGRSWRGDLIQRPAYVVETDIAGQPRAIYRYSWRSSWTATGHCLIALLGLIWHFHQPVPLKWLGRPK